MLTFAAGKLEEVECSGIEVTVVDSSENAFLDGDDVVEWLERHYGTLKDVPVSGIDKDSMEKVLARNPVVRSAEVYSSVDGRLHVGITQRRPVLRILSDKGYYVDEEGEVMPLSQRYTARVAVATGRISRTFACNRLYPFVMYLREDGFWDALVEQIVVEKEDEVLLIPKVGNFRIRLGALEHVEEKMENLRIFLQQGPALKGWNTYREINLKFKDQVVCVRR